MPSLTPQATRPKAGIFWALGTPLPSKRWLWVLELSWPTNKATSSMGREASFHFPPPTVLPWECRPMQWILMAPSMELGFTAFHVPDMTAKSLSVRVWFPYFSELARRRQICKPGHQKPANTVPETRLAIMRQWLWPQETPGTSRP